MWRDIPWKTTNNNIILGQTWNTVTMMSVKKLASQTITKSRMIKKIHPSHRISYKKSNFRAKRVRKIRTERYVDDPYSWQHFSVFSPRPLYMSFADAWLGQPWSNIDAVRMCWVTSSSRKPCYHPLITMRDSDRTIRPCLERRHCWHGTDRETPRKTPMPMPSHLQHSTGSSLIFLLSFLFLLPFFSRHSETFLMSLALFFIHVDFSPGMENVEVFLFNIEAK